MAFKVIDIDKKAVINYGYLDEDSKEINPTYILSINRLFYKNTFS